MSSSTPVHSDAYMTPYREAAGLHGSEFGVTLWASPHTQLKRFEVMKQMCAMRGKRVLDVGCSRGDFAAYLLEAGVGYERYVGVDALEDVLVYARQRGLARAAFHYGDFLADAELLESFRADVVVISGTLNTMSVEDALLGLEHAWGAAGQAMVFNFLSDRAGAGAPPQVGPARRLPTLELLEWAMEKTAYVRLRQDYFKHGHDATILMRRG